MLGLASLAKLYYTYELALLGHLFLTTSIFIALLIVSKIIFAPAAILEELNHPIVTSVSPTVPMGIMMICSVFTPFEQFVPLVTIIWSIAAITQFIIVIYFSYRFMWKKWQLQNIFPSWFVTYVGLGIIPITAPVEGVWLRVIFFFSVISAIILVPTVLYRIIVKKDIPEPASPLITILAAPSSISLLAYLSQYAVVDQQVIWLLFILSQILYLFVLIKLTKLLQLPFYPSYAAFTFPLVICATAFYAAREQLALLGPVSLIIAYVELSIATVLVVYVTIRYTRFITR